MDTQTSVTENLGSSRGYLWFRNLFSWPLWYRWWYGFNDCEIIEKQADKRSFLVIADHVADSLYASIVPRIGDVYPGYGRCVEIHSEVYLPGLCWKVTATYR